MRSNEEIHRCQIIPYEETPCGRRDRLTLTELRLMIEKFCQNDVVHAKKTELVKAFTAEYQEIDDCVNRGVHYGLQTHQEKTTQLKKRITAVNNLFSTIPATDDITKERLIALGLLIQQLGDNGNTTILDKKIYAVSWVYHPHSDIGDNLMLLRETYASDYLEIIDALKGNPVAKKEIHKLDRLENLTGLTGKFLQTITSPKSVLEKESSKERYNHIKQFKKDALQLSTSQKVAVALVAFTGALLIATLGLLVAGFFTASSPFGAKIGLVAGAALGASGGAYLAREGFFKFSSTNHNKQVNRFANSFKDLVKDEKIIENMDRRRSSFF